MSKNPAQFNEINFLPEDPFFATTLGRVIRWALTAGRYMVIFTELIVIVSFATRFKLDRQRTDLNQSIAQKMAVIESYGDLEERFKSIQARLNYFKQVQNQKIDTDFFLYLNKVIPSGIKIEKLTITHDTISVAGVVPSQEQFNTLIANLRQSRYFDQVSVGKIEKNAKTQEFSFQFNAQISQQSVK